MKTLIVTLSLFAAIKVSAQGQVIHVQDGQPSGTAVGNKAIINTGNPTTPNLPSNNGNYNNQSTKTSQGYPVNQPSQGIEIKKKEPIPVNNGGGKVSPQ